MKWGILATGNIAKKFASTVIRMENEGEVLAAVGSRTLESAKAFAKEYGIDKYYDSYEALAKDPEVEAVYVATPNSMHYENCRLCLLNGKHVLCEKPFTINVGQAKELYALAAEKGLFIMEAFWIWFLPLYGRLREVISDGIIGEIRQIKCEYGFVAEGARRERKFKSGLGGGALLDIGIYNLGFLYLLMRRPPESFISDVHMNEYGTDDYSRLVFTYSGGCTAESVQTIGSVLERNATITGTKGSVFLKDFQHATEMSIRLNNQEEDKEVQKETGKEGREEIKVECPVEINGFEYEIREASRCVREGKSFSDFYTPKDNMAVLKLMDDIRRGWNMRFEGEHEF